MTRQENFAPVVTKSPKGKPIYGFITQPGRFVNRGGYSKDSSRLCRDYQNSPIYSNPKNGYENVPKDYVLTNSGCERGNCEGVGAWCWFMNPNDMK